MTIGVGTYVTTTVGEQIFGIPVMYVRDILGPQAIAPVPLAPAGIAGSLNLRGHILTVLDMRTRLGLSKRPVGMEGMSIVVDHKGELYSLLVDAVGDVMELADSECEENPPNLDPSWHAVSEGIYRLKDHLLMILAVPNLLRFS